MKDKGKKETHFFFGCFGPFVVDRIAGTKTEGGGGGGWTLDGQGLGQFDLTCCWPGAVPYGPAFLLGTGPATLQVWVGAAGSRAAAGQGPGMGKAEGRKRNKITGSKTGNASVLG